MKAGSSAVMSGQMHGLLSSIRVRSEQNPFPAYTGAPYGGLIKDEPLIGGSYLPSMHVSVRIELADALGANFNGAVNPLHFSFDDGRGSIADLTADMTARYAPRFYFATDATGAVVNWFVSAHTVGSFLDHFILSEHGSYFASEGYAAGEYEFGEISSEHAKWASGQEQSQKA